MLTLLSNKNKVVIAPSTIIFATFFWLGLYFLFYIKQILIMLFLALILMSAFNPAVNWCQRRLKMPRFMSAIAVYIGFMMTLSLFFAVVVPPLVTELSRVVVELNVLMPSLSLPVFQDLFNNFQFTVAELDTIFSNIARVSSSVWNFFSFVLPVFVVPTVTGIFTFFSTMVMSVFLLIDRPHLYKKVSWFTKEARHLELAKEFIDRIEYQLGAWVRGQLILMLLIGFLTFVGLSLLGIPYALPLALLAGMLEILPNLGPTIAAVPAVLLAFSTGGWFLGLVTIGFSMLVQQLENNLIVPKIMKDNVDVNPLVAIVVILTGFQVGSVMGALLAIPVYIVARTLYSMWYREQR